MHQLKARLVLAGCVVSIVLLAVAAPLGRSAVRPSSFVSDEALRAHGIDLAALSSAPTVALVDVHEAEAVAKDEVGLDAPPREAHRVAARVLPGDAPRSAWLVLYGGGAHAGAVGPPEGADARVLATNYTGVLVDDQTGELMRWFQGGTLSG